jgi:Mn2+/Fe2+ NRAMP family transporter
MKKQSTNFSSVLLGAAFLMATSAIGPGFLTQTVVFTDKLKADFAFVIAISIVLDLVAQLNIWQIITISGKRAQDLSNDLGWNLGYFLAMLIVFGGFIFNIGNIAGCGLGFQVLFGIDTTSGAILSAIISIFIFSIKQAGDAMDTFAKALGLLMIALVAYIAYIAQPPIFQAIEHTFLPQQIDFKAIVTLVGGTVGGYITFAGAHRLLDAGIQGEAQQSEIKRSAIMAISMASIMRILLFLGALGIVTTGFSPDAINPTASIFKQAAGEWGNRFFGIVLWSAAITSVIGSAYTSISFIRNLHPFIEKHSRHFTIAFILASTLVFVFVGKPIQLLVFAGLVNGFILPLSLGILLVAVRSKRLFPSYQHPLWLQISGWLVVLAMSWMSFMSFF